MNPVFVGYRCDNACVFCAQGALRSSPDGRDDAAVRRDLSALAAKAGRGFPAAFVGGEPLLREELSAWVAEAKRLGAGRVVVQTNGRRLAARARELARAGLDGADVSLHGSTAPMHEYHTSVPGSFEETLAGIRAARRAGLEVGITCVATRSNFRHLDEVVRLAASLGAAAVHFAPAVPSGRARDAWERVVPHPDVIAESLARALSAAKGLGLPVLSAGAASGAPAEGFFAGLGPVEPAPAEPGAAAAPALPTEKKRPAPGAREVRARSRKTGEDLREIFPALFEKGA